MKKIFFILLFFINKSFAQTTTGVYINEIMASNDATITDNTGEYTDWIELYNSNSFSVDLANYYLSDTPTNLTKFRFTSVVGQVVVPANGHLIIWASGVTTRGAKHISFSLSIEGEAIVLTAPNGTTIVDGFAFGKQRTDVSYGRLPDGGVDFKYFSPSSPNNANSASNSYIGILPPPVFSHRGGFYSSPFALSINHIDPNVNIYYTSDGSNPDPANLTSKSYSYRNNYPYGASLSRSYVSNLYSLPINIVDRANTANQISNISTTFNLGYSNPPNVIYKGTVIQSRAYQAGYLPSDPVTHTFFFTATGTNKYSLPVISLVSQEDNLFSYDEGIYVPGIDFERWISVNPNVTPDGSSPANYKRIGSSAERAATLELIENDTVVIQKSVGIRINGGWSRQSSMKSLRVYVSGDGLDYKLFPGSDDKDYKTFLLRNSGNDFGITHFRDALIQKSVEHLRINTQKYRSSIVFLNGEYWGIHNIRERYDVNYFNRVYGINENNIDILEYTSSPTPDVDAGDAAHFNAMIDYVNQNDLQVVENYDYLKTQMDMDNYIDYYISQIFSGNIDWPHNNILFWREKIAYTPNAPYGRDGRWRWALFDTDFSYNDPVENTLGRLFTTDNWSTNTFTRIARNAEFKNTFINRFADLLNTAFLINRINSLIDEKRLGILSEINEHNSRWNHANWESYISYMREFAERRPTYQRGQIRDRWQISGEYNLTVNVSNATHGYVRVNSIDIVPTTPGVSSNSYPWTGSYFNNIPIQIRPIAKTGYKFKHWVHNSAILSDSVITINTSAAQSYTAIFELYTISPNPTPTPANLNLCEYSFQNWAATSAIGTSPASMKFVYMIDNDPPVNSSIAGFTSGAYNLSSRTRINGLGASGFSFINTGSAEGNPGYPGMKLGGAILALNTTDKSKVSVSWVGRTIIANSRVYRIRLQYRIGDIQPFNDLLDANGQAVEYVRGVTGSSLQMPEVSLPTSVLNQPYVQLLWRYYYTGVQNDLSSGARDELGIDEIKIKSELTLSGNSIVGVLEKSANKIFSSESLSLSSIVGYSASESITLIPGFKADANTIFSAQIVGCQ